MPESYGPHSARSTGHCSGGQAVRVVHGRSQRWSEFDFYLPPRSPHRNSDSARQARDASIRMKIATFNVNGINGRLSVLLRWLEQSKPDVVCLQELKASQEKFPERAILAAGYSAIWQGQKSWNGVAILARGVEPKETRRGLPGDPDD